MREAIQNLIQLQQIDQKLDGIEQAKGNLPEKVNTLENKLAEAQHKIIGARENRQNLEKEKRLVERQISTLRENKKKYEEQLYAVTTNKEYDAVTVEIETAIAKIDEKETEFLQLIEEEESTEAQIGELEKAIAQMQIEYQKQTAYLNEKIAENAEMEKKLQQERKALVDRLKIEQIRLYNKIRKNKDGLAVVPIVRSSCGGCYTHIPPQRSMEVRDGDKLIVCESCGRILFWQEKETANAA